MHSNNKPEPISTVTNYQAGVGSIILPPSIQSTPHILLLPTPPPLMGPQRRDVSMQAAQAIRTQSPCPSVETGSIVTADRR
jgi:hypothetical protein